MPRAVCTRSRVLFWTNPPVHNRLLRFQIAARRVAFVAMIGLICALYLADLTGMGLVSADEPRYAAIGQAMARSGDWVTPRLWGQPWFEKPALLYWMTAAAFRLGLGEDLAPRLPVALLSVAFLIFFQWILGRDRHSGRVGSLAGIRFYRGDGPTHGGSVRSGHAAFARLDREGKPAAAAVGRGAAGSGGAGEGAGGAGAGGAADLVRPPSLARPIARIGCGAIPACSSAMVCAVLSAKWSGIYQDFLLG